MIQKAIRRAFFKAGAVILALAAALTLFLCYGLSPIIDVLYYDPAEYVGQHGMRFMGIAVYGSRETLQKLLDHPLVSMVTLEQE